MKKCFVVFAFILANFNTFCQDFDPILCEPWLKNAYNDFIDENPCDFAFYGDDPVGPSIQRGFKDGLEYIHIRKLIEAGFSFYYESKFYTNTGFYLGDGTFDGQGNGFGGDFEENEELLYNCADEYPSCESSCLTCRNKSNPLIFNVTQDTSITIEHLMSETTQGCTLSFDRTQSITELPFACSFLKGQLTTLDSFWVYDIVKGDSCLSFIRFVNGDFCKCSNGTFISTNINDQRTICNLQNIENRCFRMKVVQDKSWWKRNWLCENGGNVEAPNLLTLIAGSGNYKININASNCTIDQNGFKGIQIGLFSDSVFQNTVFCANGVNLGNGLTNVEIPSNVLTPSQKYFLIIDGYANSFCDININISGSYVPFSIPILECHPKINPLQFVIKKDTTLNVNSLILQPNCSNLSFDRDIKLINKDIDCTSLKGQQSALDSFWVYDVVKGDSCLSYVRFVNGGYCSKLQLFCNDTTTIFKGIDHHTELSNVVQIGDTLFMVWSNGTYSGQAGYTIYDGNIYLSKSINNGITWDTEIISNTPWGTRYHKLVVDVQGNLNLLCNVGTKNGYYGLEKTKLSHFRRNAGVWNVITDNLGVGNGYQYNSTVVHDLFIGADGILRMYYSNTGWYARGATLYYRYFQNNTWSTPITIQNNYDNGIDSQNNYYCFKETVNGKTKIYVSSGWKCTGVGCTPKFYNKIKIYEETNLTTYTLTDSLLNTRWFYRDDLGNEVIVPSNGKEVYLNQQKIPGLEIKDSIYAGIIPISDDLIYGYNASIHNISGMKVDSNIWQFIPLQNPLYNKRVGNESIIYSCFKSINNCRTRDSLALVDFWQKAGGPNWTQKWDLSKPMSTWFGISLNADGCVIGITFPTEFVNDSCIGNNLEGIISPKIDSLSELEVLQFPCNKISGSIPTFQNNKKLRWYVSNRNMMDGEISNLSNLPKLEGFDISYNEHIGNLPNLNNNINLDYFACWDNNLKGSLPDFSYLKKLRWFDCGANNFVDTFPNLSNNVDLEVFWIPGNDITGQLPDLSIFKNLSQFSVASCNYISGSIPDLTQNNTLLRFLASGNQLSGSIPDLSNNKMLRDFYVSSNQLSGSVPDLSNNDQLEGFFCSNNKIDSIPPLILNSLTFKDGLRCSNNKLTFDDILPNIQYATTATFIYTPQDSIYRDTTFTRKEGESLTIDLGIDAAIATNVYKWYKDGVFIDSITGSNKRTFTSIKQSDAGVWTVRVTNPGAPLLTLQSRKITIQLECIATTSINDIQICQGESISIGSNFYSSNGMYVDTLVSFNGCDSIINTILTVIPTPKIDNTIAICNGDNHVVGNKIYSISGTYLDTLQSIFGCDSIITTFLTVRPSQNISFNAPDKICKGTEVNLSVIALGTYLWSDGQTTSNVSEILNANKTYQVTVTDQFGCKASSSISITVVEPKINAIPIADTLILCFKDSIINPYNLLAQFDANGTWTLDEINISGQPFNLMELTEGIHTFNYGFSQQAPCSDMDTSFILLIKDCRIMDCSFTLIDDSIRVNKNEASEISLTINDILPEEYIISIISVDPDVLESTNLSDEGLYSFTVTGDFGDIVQVVYEICTPDCADCKQASLWIDNEALKDIIRTNIILPNTSGQNATLRFTDEDILRDSELYIFNRNGDRIFHMKDYDNSWNADGYPGGIYFYVLRYRGVDIKKTLTVMK